MTTIADVARHAGVSVATVSHVMNRTRHVEPETAERVHSAIAALRYRPNTLARSLRRGELVMRRLSFVGVCGPPKPMTAERYFGAANFCAKSFSSAAFRSDTAQNVIPSLLQCTT